jgi:8-oxo-dGTP pyrophosphatase MutT (NUDIX family)
MTRNNLKINLNGIRFVRKDRTLLDNPYKTIMEESKTGYVYEDNVEGVAIIPYRMGANGKEILIRDEYTPLHDTVLSIITGGRDKDDKNGQAAARRELLEEAGILAEERWFNEVGDLVSHGSQKRPDTMYIVDVTGVHQGKPSTDGSIFEKKSTNMWVPVSELARMVREPSGIPDAYFLAAITKFLVWCGLLKSEESDLEKAKKGEERPGHKYIRRSPLPAGGYKYIYKEPEQKGPKKEDEKKPKGGIMEQLAALLGKKQGSTEEKKPKKVLPFQEFPVAPEGMPDFRKGFTAAQWITELDRMVTSTTQGFMAELDDADYEMMNEPKRFNSTYADAVIEMLDAGRSAYSSQDVHSKDILVDNKKLDERASAETKKGIIVASSCLSQAKHLTASLNSSLTEKVFSNIAEKLDAGASHNKLDKIIKITSTVKDQLENIDVLMRDIKWLQGSDQKLDWMIDSTFKAVDELMQARNRFVTNGFKFYIDQLTPKLESLADAEEIGDSLKLLDGFENFRHESMYSSTTSNENESFANQWNMKQRGMYDGASRFSAYASGKLVDKVKGLEDLHDDKILQGHIEEMAKSAPFAFLSMSKHISSFQVSEQVFSYIDLHGMDKYYQDMVFLTGGRKPPSEAKYQHYKEYVRLLTEAYNGKDVYEDEDMKDVASFSGGQMGDMVKSHPASTVYAAMNTMLLLNKKTPITSRAPAFIRMWSTASHNSLMSNVLEEFVSSKNIDRGSYVNYHIASNRTVTPRRASVKEGLAYTANEIYTYSQELMRSSDEYKKDTIKLYRGNGKSEVKSVASSWTPRDDVAANFGHSISMVDAPKEAVFLFNDIMNEDHWTYPNEREFILMPGLLPADKKLNPEALAPSARQSILDKQIDKIAETYDENY